MNMEQVFGKPLVTQEAMRARIKELGQEITKDYCDKRLVLVGILKGAFAFYADLIRVIRLPVRVDFMMVQNQKSHGSSQEQIKVMTDVTEDIQDRDLLLVEDIVDSGLTAQYLITLLGKRKPKSIEVCTLLSKPERRQVHPPIRYVGFEIPNQYVVGYGLDYQQQYRNLPYLAVLDPNKVELTNL